jgi:hypothetical protein
VSYAQFRAAVAAARAAYDGPPPGLARALLAAGLRWALPALALGDALFFLFRVAAAWEGAPPDVAAALFPEVRAYVERVCGAGVLGEWRPFEVESCFAAPPAVPVLLFAADTRDSSLSLIRRAAAAGCDAFESISICDSRDSIDRARQTLATAVNRGQLLLIHYARPSLQAALFLNQTAITLAATPVSPKFRLIINCKTARFLSSQLLVAARQLADDGPPLMKPDLITLYQNFGAVLEQTSKPRIVRRLFHAGALVFAQIWFRAFMRPLGFNAGPHQTSESFRTFVEYLKEFIESVEVDCASRMRNLREFVETVSFGGSVVDTHDRRKIRAIVASFFSPAVLSDAFKFMEPDSREADIWKFPGEGTSLAFLKPIPLFPSLDVLMVDHAANEIFHHWNLSRWLSKPFMAILDSTEVRQTEQTEARPPIIEAVEGGESKYMKSF